MWVCGVDDGSIGGRGSIVAVCVQGATAMGPFQGPGWVAMRTGSFAAKRCSRAGY